MTLLQEVRQDTPILLFNDECGVCRRIAKWVAKSASSTSGSPSIVERPIGDDPDALLDLNAGLDIWDAYETIHLLMPDGSMKVGGEACAEVLRRLPTTRWLAPALALHLFGFRPFQRLLNTGYAVLSEIRPLFGCESCGTPSPWVRPIASATKRAATLFGQPAGATPSPHFTGIKKP
jgi:predicted DCC family thiol-disulfide oxidoreductase YuxK